MVHASWLLELVAGHERTADIPVEPLLASQNFRQSTIAAVSPSSRAGSHTHWLFLQASHGRFRRCPEQPWSLCSKMPSDEVLKFPSSLQGVHFEVVREVCRRFIKYCELKGEFTFGVHNDPEDGGAMTSQLDQLTPVQPGGQVQDT